MRQFLLHISGPHSLARLHDTPCILFAIFPKTQMVDCIGTDKGGAPLYETDSRNECQAFHVANRIAT